MKKLLFSLLIIILSTSCSSEKKQLDISGEWTVRLDSTDVGIKESWQGNLFETPMQLPGTTDDAGLGTLNAWNLHCQNPSYYISHVCTIT